MRHIGVSSGIVGALAAAMVAAPSPAHPPRPVDQSGHRLRGKLHTWLHRAQVPLVRGRLQIRRADCPGNAAFVGCVYLARPRTIYLSRRAHDPRLVLYHELGHAFDVRVSNTRDRRRFKRIMGIHQRGWFHGDLPSSEWFADGYAACAVRLRVGKAAGRTLCGYAPTRRQHARVCRLIQAAAKPRGRPPQRPQNPPPVVEVAPPPPQESQPSDGGCTMVDQLLTGCKPPAPAPPSPLPVRAGA